MSACAITAAGLALCAAPAQAVAEIDLRVSGDQAVTIAGDSPSLRAVVEAICERAGIELRAYGAADREFHGSYVQVPASGLLPRLLRDESHLVGLTKNEIDGRTRIAWLRVLGDPSSPPSPVATPLRAAHAHVAEPLPTHPVDTFARDKRRVLQHLAPIFESDEPEREQAIEAFAQKVTVDAPTRELFLGASETDIAGEIAEYRDAVRILGRVQGALRNAQAREYLRRITAQVGAIVRERAHSAADRRLTRR